MATITNLTHFLDDSGFIASEAPAPARALGDQLAAIVECATAAGRRDRWTTSLRCRRRPKRRPCPANIVVQLVDIPAEVRWSCPACGDVGTITGFKGTAYDLSDRRPPDGPRDELRLSADEHAALLAGVAPDPEHVTLLRAAPLVGDRLVVSIPLGELEYFVDAVAADANHARSHKVEELLDAVFERATRLLDGPDPEVLAPASTRGAGDPALGSWRITDMELWGLEAIELCGPGLIELGADGFGYLRFIAVSGQMDWRREGERVEFSWVGDDEGDPVSGRGWFRVDGDEMTGRIYFHAGDESGFRARRVEGAGR